MLNQNLLLGSDGYLIQRSLRFRSSASAYLNRTFATPTDNKKWTFSGWVKRGAVDGGSYTLLGSALGGASTYSVVWFSGNQLNILQVTGGSVVANLNTTAVYRDPSAFYHIVVVWDSANATSSSRILLYVNGVQVTAFATATYPSLNLACSFNLAGNNVIGSRNYASDSYFDGYLTEVNFIDGQALTPSSFGSTNSQTGVWKPKKYAGTYGANGFYLNFSDNSSTTNLCLDKSGNANNWTPNNISVTAGATYDSMTDVPTMTSESAGNFAVLNPLANGAGTLSNANLNLLGASAAWGTRISTIGVDSGKWYFEVTPLSGSATQGIFFGITQVENPTTHIATQTGGYGYYGNDGKKYSNGGVGATYGATVADNDVVGVAFDRNSGTLEFFKNNTSQGVAYTGLTSGTYYLGVSCYGTATAAINFGQRPFAYTPPTGFKSLNTFNLPEPSIKAGNKHFDATTYTGNGSTQSIVNSGGFQPDFVWLKARSNAYTHVLVDSIRGTDKVSSSASTSAENSTNPGEDFTAFNSNGFSVGTPVSFNSTNANGATIVGWQWKANGSAVSNTAGSITSQVSANASAGFSIVTYTGNGSASTVGHGLGVAPKMIIVKNRSFGTYSWTTWHGTFSANQYFYLSGTDAVATSTGPWNNTLPTSSVFSIGADLGTNRNGDNYVAYLFAEVAGYSKFGSYTGNGSADGTFVHLGFRPKFVMIKNTTSVDDNWIMQDSIRSSFNLAADYLIANGSSAESTYGGLDFTSNGFKIRTSSTATNASSNTYIYMAFAENPQKYSLGR